MSRSNLAKICHFHNYTSHQLCTANALLQFSCLYFEISNLIC